MKRKPIIGVIGSHEDEWEQYAVPLGTYIAKNNYHLLTGAGGGVMTAVAKAFTAVLEKNSMCIGLYPVKDYNQKINHVDFPNPYIEIPIVTLLSERAQSDTVPESRNAVNILSSDVIVALPGLHGTMNEVSLSLMAQKPMILFGKVSDFQDFPEQAQCVETMDELEQFIQQQLAQH